MTVCNLFFFFNLYIYFLVLIYIHFLSYDDPNMTNFYSLKLSDTIIL